MNKDLNTLVIHHKPVSELVLKRLLLIFDHVWTINPIENLSLIPNECAKIKYNKATIVQAAYGVFYKGAFYKKKEEQLIDVFDYAYNKGALKVVNLRASKFFQKYWLPLRLTYDFDTANESLLKKSKELMEIDKTGTPINGVLRGGFLAPSGVKIYPDIPKVPDLFNEDDDKKYHLNLQLFSIIGKINRALAVCGEYDLVPTFISETILNIFDKKQDISKNNTEPSVNETFFKKNNYNLQNVQHLLYKISEFTIPNDVLNNISVKELIIARNNTFHELFKLRRQLISNIKFLTQHQFDSSMNKEVNSFLTKEFEPQLKNYQSKFGSTFHKMLNYSSVFTFGALGATISLISSLSPLQLVFLTGISATVGSSISDLSTYFSNNNKKFKNTYGYFLNFNE